jgi:TRAP-type C4-dicarboxylate transport system permease small subunit
MERPLSTMSPVPVYTRLSRLVDTIDAALLAVGCLMLFLLMLVVVADVSLRYLFNAPLAWSYEVISSYLMPGLFFLAASHTLKSNAHVCVDILHNYVGRKTRYAFEAISSVLAAPIFGLAAAVSAQNTWHDLQQGSASSSGMELPTWTISLMLPLGFGLLTLRLVLHAIGYIGTLVSGRELKPLPAISGTEELTS